MVSFSRYRVIEIKEENKIFNIYQARGVPGVGIMCCFGFLLLSSWGDLFLF